MKKHITLLIIFLSMSITFYAQKNDRDSRNKIMTAKISFISNELELTTNQAEKFWPVYNGLREEIYSLYREKRDLERNIDYNNITEKEAKVLFEKIMLKNTAIDNKKADFMKELSTIINYKQLLKLNHAEHKFKKNLLERIKKDN